ncbi:hypothetical protein [Thalassotalea castellviae]|uniref:Uncharacterized protein n=1 Tax=Thalassotalea castellviae TaxID=3075612 RepID=A0ABU3A0V4_9GAMM|nr:hypothetical protein [Thalassotalea sp. W431]MDT0603801.1 hypothetical protein [Thalassotalea sp. W431]
MISPQSKAINVNTNSKESKQFQNSLLASPIRHDGWAAIYSDLVPIPEHVLLYTPERIAQIKEKISQDSTAWDVMKSKISHYFDRIPYNAGEYAGAFAAAYYISGDKKYIDRAIELITHAYFSEPNIGWQYYSSRNQFRGNGRWAIMGYTWVKHFLSLEEQRRIEKILKVWGDYWLGHVDYQNNFESLRIADTDNVTSITKNITLLGYVFSYSTIYKDYGVKLLEIGDELLNQYVVDYYMNNIMAGGAWAEGSDYSPATQMHWIETFLINKDQRGIPYPTNYASQALRSLIHQTLAGGTGVYKYGSEERAVDYDHLGDDYRYAFALNLMSILETPEDIGLINHWFNQVLEKQGFAKGSMVTGLNRLLYHDPNALIVTPNEIVPTLHVANGIGFVAARNDWSDEATNLYFINRSIRVDHEHKDALSFDVAYKGRWITKERTGYGGVSVSSRAHNTILIENASADGSSSPTGRAAGKPKLLSVVENKYVTTISADATQTYNMSGYFATDYAKRVNRQIAFIKPSTVIVYDHVVTDKTKVRDLVQYKPSNTYNDIGYTRWVKLIQHVQAEPKVINGKKNSFNVIMGDNQLVYQVHWPIQATIDVINESEKWREIIEYQMPENQRKWHFEVSKSVATERNEFITSLNFGSTEDVEHYLLDAFVLTKENGFIIEGDVRGVAVYVNSNPHIVLFNKYPELSSSPVKFKVPDGFDEAIVSYVGFSPL